MTLLVPLDGTALTVAIPERGREPADAGVTVPLVVAAAREGVE